MENSSTFTLNAYKAYAETSTLQEFVLALANELNVLYPTEKSAIKVTLTTSTTVIATTDVETVPAVIHCGNDSIAISIHSSNNIDASVATTIEELILRKDKTLINSYDISVETAMRILGITYHDVRNTLGSISGIVQLMEMDAGDNKELLDSIRDIVNIIDRYDTDSVQVMKLLRNQPFSYDKRPFDFTTMCNTILKRNSRVYELSSISVTASVQDDINCIGDEDKIRDIFQELLTNAATALGENGGEINVSVEKDVENVKISVSHNGTPIKSDVQEYIFTPFFTTKEKGRGMGLTRIDRYLKAWGGDIELFSNSNQPVCFVVTFPVTLP